MTRPIASTLVILALATGCPDPESGDDEVAEGSTPPPQACLTDDDCPNTAEPFCDGGVCVACVSANDCQDPELPMCTSGTCVAPCTIDAQEPNDSSIMATPVDDFDLLTGSLCPGDEDWFSFTITETLYVGVSARYDGRHGDLDFELRDTKGGIWQVADGNDIDYYTAEAIHRRLFLPGTYKVRVYLDSGLGGVAYKIRFHLLRRE